MAGTHAEPDYIRQKDNKNLDHIPGDYGSRLFGYTFRLVMNPFDEMHKLVERFGLTHRCNFTFQNVVVAQGPDAMRELTMDPNRVFSARMGYDAPLGDFFAGGLLMRDFDEHKFHRRIMQTAFKTSVMRGYIEQINELTARRIAEWGSQKKFLYYDNIKHLLLDIGAEVFVGLELGHEAQRLNSAFLDMMGGTLALIRKDWPGLVYHKGMNGRRYLEKYFNDLVPGRRTGVGTDMMSYFCREKAEDGEFYSDKVVAEHTIFLLLAAHDTTTSALTMGSYYLAHDQVWQERLRREYRALGKPALGYDDLGDSVADTELVFKEVLRLHPAVPNMMRRTVRDCEFDGFSIPAHSVILTSPLYHSGGRIRMNSIPIASATRVANTSNINFCGRLSVAARTNASACISPTCCSSA
jgi:cytochrome P450